MIFSNKSLKTEIGEDAYKKICIFLRNFLIYIDQNPAAKFSEDIIKARQIVEIYRDEFCDHADDEVLNDIFVLNCYIDFFENYRKLWNLIINRQFSESWVALQDCMDRLRVVRRFSRIDASKIEEQLIELEKAYPYNVFMSIGMVVEKFECSICGHDMDSPNCPHRKGHLYRGEMAFGIAKEISDIDHIAVVKSPMDKRCVTVYQNNSEQFDLILFIAKMLIRRKTSILNFGILIFTKKHKLDPQYRHAGRNDPCPCGSGIKLKRCHKKSPFIEQPHVEIIKNPITPETAIP